MKIRIPRKKKKNFYKLQSKYGIRQLHYPVTTKMERFDFYFHVEREMKDLNLNPTQLYEQVHSYVANYTIWWNWVRNKYLGLPLEHLNGLEKHFNEQMEINKINLQVK